MANRKEAQVDVITKFPGWEKLDSKQQETVKEETQEVWQLQETLGETELGIGEHLAKLQDILAPFRMFVAYVDEFFHMSRPTAYRYMEQYKAGKKYLSEPILEAAIARGVRIREDRLKEFVATNPPPKNPDAKQAQQYLSTYEAAQVREVVPVTDPDVLQKEVVTFFNNRLRKLQIAPRQKGKWVRDTLGMCITLAGITEQLVVNPVAVPEGLIPTQGRPKQETEKKEVAAAPAAASHAPAHAAA